MDAPTHSKSAQAVPWPIRICGHNVIQSSFKRRSHPLSLVLWEATSTRYNNLLYEQRESEQEKKTDRETDTERERERERTLTGQGQGQGEYIMRTRR